ncbi:MAG: hypothetical protein U1E66_12695 [Rhodospirillales bacterium]
MSTLDQKLGAQAGQAVAFATNAAVALSRQAAERQRQIAQELRTPVVVESRLEHADRKQPPDPADRPKSALSGEPDDDKDKSADPKEPDSRRIDVRV